MTNLSEWGTYYEVLGSASAALTGLQFITVALLADIPIRGPGETEAGDAFSTPTIVHFLSALFLAITGAAPWHNLAPAAILWGLAGVLGASYTVIIIRRIRSQRIYQPVFEDWFFHVLLPGLAYAALAVSAFFVRAHGTATLITVAVAAPLLLLIGVHNAWDNVTYLSLRKREGNTGSPDQHPDPERSSN